MISFFRSSGIVKGTRCGNGRTGQGDVDMLGPEKQAQESGIGPSKSPMGCRVLRMRGRNDQGKPVGVGYCVVVSIGIPGPDGRHRTPEIEVVLSIPSGDEGVSYGHVELAKESSAIGQTESLRSGKVSENPVVLDDRVLDTIE